METTRWCDSSADGNWEGENAIALALLSLPVSPNFIPPHETFCFRLLMVQVPADSGWPIIAEEEEEEEEAEDNMEEIDTDNIVGRRTRGKQVDYIKAAEDSKEELAEEDDEDEDEDFEDYGADADPMEH